MGKVAQRGASYFVKKVKVKQSRYTPWRRLRGEEI
jgi:hypothetical protein